MSDKLSFLQLSVFCDAVMIWLFLGSFYAGDMVMSLQSNT